MDHSTRRTTQQIISDVQNWVKALAQKSAQLHTPMDAVSFEQQFRDEGLEMLGSIFEKLLQNGLDHQDEQRTCPKCGGQRRHKGRRQRGLLSSVGGNPP